MTKIVTAAKAVSYIADGDSICTSGFVGTGTPDQLLQALSERFEKTQSPKALNLVFAAGQGDGKDKGLNRIAHKGLLKRVIGGHWGLAPKLGQMAINGEIEAYNLPQGVISHLFRDIAAARPGPITKVGLHTFVDPLVEGGKVNDRTTDDLVKRISLNGEEWLHYKAFPITVALLRGTTADARGNVTLEREAMTLDNLAMAQAARNNGGIVLVQVERLTDGDGAAYANPHDVIIPGALVDFVVVADQDHHWQSYAEPYNATLAGEDRIDLTAMPALPLSPRKIIARRAAQELIPNAIVNLGIGMPEGVGAVAGEEGIFEQMTLTTESGAIGGAPVGGLAFGTSYNVEAIISQASQFDFYDGNGLDQAFLGMAEVDSGGNVNVSRFGAKFAGCGGFINISQNANRLYFLGTFTAGGLDIEITDEGLEIKSEGRSPKFVSQVQQITFAGPYAAQQKQQVKFITERAVFDLRQDGLHLTEIAPGIDLERDILAHMGFTPHIGHIRTMDRKLFAQNPMGLRNERNQSHVA